MEDALTITDPNVAVPAGADQQAKQPDPAPAPDEKGRLAGFFFAINRPWILLTLPLLIGGWWLAANPGVITANLDKPYALLAGPVLVGSILAGWLVWRFFEAIRAWCILAWKSLAQARKDDGSAQFFWMVIIVFLIVSVFASGHFFTILEGDIPGLGYATALFIDLVAVQSMRARLNAVRMRDKRGAFLYLIGVFVCAGASAFANVYSDLASFNQRASGVLPPWMVNAAPWFGLVFPLLILLLSITADYTLDQVSTKLDPENYKKQEEKRVKLLEIQRDLLTQRVQYEQEIDHLTRNNGKPRRVFFLVRWLVPERQQPLDIEHVMEQVKQIYQPVIEQQQKIIEELTQARQAFTLMQQTIHQIDLQRDTDNRLLSDLIDQRETRFQGLLSESQSSLIEQVKELFIGPDTDPEIPTLEEAIDDPKESFKEDLNSPDTAPLTRPLTIPLDDPKGEVPEDLKEVFETYPYVKRAYFSGQKSLTLEESINVTGHSRKMILNRIKDGTFRPTPKNPNKYLLTSVIEWLKTAPKPTLKDDHSDELTPALAGR